MVDLLPSGFDTSLQGGERDVFDMVANWALATASDGILDFEVLFTGVDLLAQMQPTDPVALPFMPPQKEASGRDRGGWLFRASAGSNIVGSIDHFRPGARDLEEKLKRVVHDRLAPVASEKAAGLYYPLFELLAEVVGPRGVIDLFTTNYDRAVEASYEYEGKATPEVTFELVRGFRRTPRARTARWNPTDYERSSVDGLTVRLYKLHGSLDWRRENDVVVEVAADEYVARNAVIYPLRKPSPDEPFKALLGLFEQRVAGAQVCVVIGSSLRDEHIRSVLVKHLNADALHVVLVDPEIEKLRALLEAEIGTERLNRLVRSAKVKFGEPDSWPRLRSKLLDAVGHARQTPPPPTLPGAA
jgi:hypothetical protein